MKVVVLSQGYVKWYSLYNYLYFDTKGVVFYRGHPNCDCFKLFTCIAQSKKTNIQSNRLEIQEWKSSLLIIIKGGVFILFLYGIHVTLNFTSNYRRLPLPSEGKTVGSRSLFSLVDGRRMGLIKHITA